MQKAVDELGSAVADVIKLGVSLSERGINAGADAIAEKVDERKTFVEIPEIYSSDYHLKLEDANRWLEEDGFKTEAIVAKPDMAYKDCLEFEVVKTNYKIGQKVKPGTRIILRYVTSEVIDQSRKLYEESEKEKAKKDAIKAAKKSEQDAKIKQKKDKTVATLQDGASKVVKTAKKGISKVSSTFRKKED